MQPIKLALLFAVLNQIAPAGGPLRVLRVHPDTPADPLTEITVTFDRPVAGSLDGTVAADRIFRIEPAVAGKVEWRDPTTLRFVPAASLPPGATYTVTIANTFAAMDGTELQQPHTFSFSVERVKIITGDPLRPHESARFITAMPIFRVLLSAPTDPRPIVAASYVELARGCGGTRIPVNLVQLRRPNAQDPSILRYYRSYTNPRDTVRDLSRVLELRPAQRLPLGCAGSLVLPPELTTGQDVPWRFSTYGPLQVMTVRCSYSQTCPTGPLHVTFTTPVRGADIMRHVRIAPALPFTVRDTSEEADVWTLDVKLQPRQHYAVVVDSLLTDVFDQRMRAVTVVPVQTTSYAPTVVYGTGRMLVERQGFRTLAIQAVNLDTLLVTSIPVPDTSEVDFLSRSWNWEEPFQALMGRATRRKIAARGQLDQPVIVGVPFPAHDARTGRGSTLVAVKVERPGAKPEEMRGIALIQVTDLAVHGRIGIDEGWVWVTGVHDGKPRANALVTLYDKSGTARTNARTNAQGLARLTNYRPIAAADRCEGWCGGFEGYVAATLNDDRAVVGLSTYDPDLGPWSFDIWAAWSDQQRMPAAAAVFTERGIYRPGEQVYAKAIVRRGTLGSLTVPARTDSLKWVFSDREAGVLKETTTALSAFGTAHQTLTIGAEQQLGIYQVSLALKHQGVWQKLGTTTYQVAEYRPPEFLVEINADQTPRYAGDHLSAQVSARYLFGAPMAKAPVRWIVQQRPLFPWDLKIPNVSEWTIGGVEDYGDIDYNAVQVAAEGTDTLDARGAVALNIPLRAPANGLGARTGIVAMVTDANRQTVSAGSSVIVHPAAFYIGAKTRGKDYFWRAGTPVTVDLIAVSPTGERVSGIDITGSVVRREWHQARRMRDGQVNEVGGWVSDTIASCRVRSAAEPVSCTFTPQAGGSYFVSLSARDAQRRVAHTVLHRWAAGAGWVPWRDDNKLRIDVIADKQRYTVGDTATLLVASPFTGVEAWITFERERVLESRRIRVTSGATTIKLPITEKHAPNVFVSVLMVRGRSAEPGPLDDPGRPTLRVGYATLRVEPAVKRLNVEVSPLRPEYRPGDTARVRVAVRTAGGVGQRAEVTLWAVDEGVLALTGYKTPDPIDLIYRERPLGVRLASNLTSVAPQIPEGQKGNRAPGGGGGADISAILRSRFQTTAFFLGSVVTDAAGNATAAAKLPDNLTTFRLMAIAVTAGDRYGSGESSLLVTRPLVARPSLPRFVREGDKFIAGVVVNQRMGGTQRVEVEATARGIRLEGGNRKSQTLNGAAAGEVRFNFVAQANDSARFQFAARANREADAVALSIPVRPNYHPLAQTIAGVLHDTATAEFVLDPGVDPQRSRLEVSFGTSTSAVIRGARRTLRVYPYYCTEQIASTALPIIALYAARQEHAIAAESAGHAQRDIETALRTLIRRQRPDGAIGYWSSNDWSTPWVTAYAGRVLLEARAAGFEVDDQVFTRMADYLSRSLRQQALARYAISYWYTNSRIVLSDRIAAVDLLSRLGRPDVPMENTLLNQAAQMHWEDRVLLAEVLARRRATQTAARNLLTAAWQSVRLEGRRVTLAATTGREHYFHSHARPAARLLTATLAIDPRHQLIGPLVETLVQQGRQQTLSWNTQDYGYTVLALTEYERERAAQPPVNLALRGARGTLLSRRIDGATRDTTFPLTGLVDRNGRVRLSLNTSTAGTQAYYYLTVREVPRVRPVTPVDRGIQVERWYENVNTRAPIVRVAEGELVRVRLRITVPDERQFVVLDDPLPAGLEPVDLSLRTVSPFGAWQSPFPEAEQPGEPQNESWYFGSWDSGLWSAFDHKEMRDDRVVYSAAVLWKGRYTATYLARATTAGEFMVPPAHAEEMYNPGVNGRTGGSVFTVVPR